MMAAPCVAVLGAGAWGTTLAALLAGQGVLTRLWVREPEVAAQIQATRVNERFLSGVMLPPALHATPDISEALAGAHLLVLAVPSRWMRASCREFAAVLGPQALPVVTVTKGLEIETGKRMSEVIAEELPHLSAIAALSGPNLAREIALGQPAATVIASADAPLARWAQELFWAPHFRPYTGVDLIGVEICGAVKNVIALAAGICEGLGFGDNAKAALLTRAVAEIARLVDRLGGRAETVAGLAGIGDLIATCASPFSRNHQVGLACGRGEDYREALGTSGQVAEGVFTAQAVVRLARRLDVELPICEQVHAILFEGYPVREAVAALMSRERRSEHLTG
jgi:glycerol-3-phosphate dehydrogenase (NAD(P)+)